MWTWTTFRKTVCFLPVGCVTISPAVWRPQLHLVRDPGRGSERPGPSPRRPPSVRTEFGPSRRRSRPSRRFATPCHQVGSHLNHFDVTITESICPRCLTDQLDASHYEPVTYGTFSPGGRLHWHGTCFFCTRDEWILLAKEEEGTKDVLRNRPAAARIADGRHRFIVGPATGSQQASVLMGITVTVFQLVLFGCAMCVLLVSLGAIAWLEDHRDLALSRQRSAVSGQPGAEGNSRRE